MESITPFKPIGLGYSLGAVETLDTLTGTNLVPEPATLDMLDVGFAALGLFILRKRGLGTIFTE